MHLFGRDLEARTSQDDKDPTDAVRLSIWAHMETVRIHPFHEGNGKTARHLMNAILMRWVTGPTRVVIIPDGARERYVGCVQNCRQGKDAAFEAFLTELLEQMATEVESRGQRLLSRLRRKKRR
jgi:Fic family protein